MILVETVRDTGDPTAVGDNNSNGTCTAGNSGGQGKDFGLVFDDWRILIWQICGHVPLSTVSTHINSLKWQQVYQNAKVFKISLPKLSAIYSINIIN